MPQNKVKLEDNPQYKLLSPENKDIIYKEVYGTDRPKEESTTWSPIEAPDPYKLRTMEVKPVERSWAEWFRDLPVPVNFSRRPGGTTEIKMGLPSIVEGLPSMLGPVGGTLGSMTSPITGPAGPIAGYAIGTGVGMGARQGLQNLSPELFGESKSFGENLPGDVIGALMNALPGLGKLAFSKNARERAKESLVRSFFKNRLSPEAQAALKADPSMPISVGQVTGNEALENIYAKTQKEDLVKNQIERVKQQGQQVAEDLSPQEITREARGVEGARLTREYIKDRELVERNLRKDIEDAGNLKTRFFDYDPKTSSMVEIQPGDYTGSISQRRIQAPITLTKSSQYSDTMIKELDALMEDVKGSSIPVTGEIAAVRNYLQGFRKPSKTSGVPNIEPFAKIEEAREALDKVLERAKPLERKTVALEELRDSLDKDIKNSITRWGAGSLDKYKSLRSGKEFRKGLFAKDVRKSLQESGEFPSKFYDEAMSSSEAARRYAISEGIASESRLGYQVNKTDNPLAREYVTRIMEKHSEKDFFRGKQAFEDFNKDLKEQIPQKFLNAETRNNLKHLFERASIPKRPSEIGSYALEMHKGSVILRLGRAAAQHVGMGQFARGILVNPKMARYAAELIRTPAESGRAKILTRALRVGLQLPEVENE